MLISTGRPVVRTSAQIEAESKEGRAETYFQLLSSVT